jgi:hypothetical protein
MTEASNGEAKALQRDVQRLLGRCMLRLQQYERLLKAILVSQDMSGPIHKFETLRAARADGIARKTLGKLVNGMLGSVLTSSETDAAPETGDDPGELPSVSFRMRMELPETDFAQTEVELRELVHLRNTLVHHFIEQHDLGSVEGCKEAQAALIAHCKRIDHCYARLREWAEDFDRLQQQVAEFHHSETFRRLIVHGIMPDGSVNWPASSLVSSFREAARVLAGSEGAWVSVEEASRLIVGKHPDQTPERFGCKSWKQALQQSKLFDLRHVQQDGRRIICFKPKANPTMADAPERTWALDATGALVRSPNP